MGRHHQTDRDSHFQQLINGDMETTVKVKEGLCVCVGLGVFKHMCVCLCTYPIVCACVYLQ